MAVLIDWYDELINKQSNYYAPKKGEIITIIRRKHGDRTQGKNNLLTKIKIPYVSVRKLEGKSSKSNIYEYVKGLDS